MASDSQPVPSQSPYIPGYIAWPDGPPSSIQEKARLFREQVEAQRAKIREQQEQERAEAEKNALKSVFEKEQEAIRRVREQELKENLLREELAWVKMGGLFRGTKSEEDLMLSLDEDANLTQEELKLKKAWEEYDRNWEVLSRAIMPLKTFVFRKMSFCFTEIPWPVVPPNGDTSSLDLKDITVDAIGEFLSYGKRDSKKSRKERLRDAMLRYHPDKFEGRILARVIAEDRERVREAAGVVMKCLNELASVKA